MDKAIMLGRTTHMACPLCGRLVKVRTDRCLAIHINPAKGWSRRVHCPASGKSPNDLPYPTEEETHEQKKTKTNPVPIPGY